VTHHVRISDDGAVEGDLDAVARLISEASRPAALTGAGISVDSGIPDFRSPGGLWSVFDPAEYATLSCFVRDPGKAWELYRALGKTLLGKRPNAAHLALAELERAGRLEGVITQNVDGLHQAAGSRTVLEIHGDHRRLECLRCRRSEPFLEAHLEPGPVPRCAACGHPLKPGVVLFEEPVRAMPAIDRLLSSTDLLLTVGTSAQVVPASLFPAHVRAAGGRVIELNLERELPEAVLVPDGAFVQGSASVTLPRVAERVRAARATERPA
jgi:NAD-dependent deacetylase